MSTGELSAERQPTRVSLADEEGVERIAIDMLFGLGATVKPFPSG